MWIQKIGTGPVETNRSNMTTTLTITNGWATIGCPCCNHPKPIKARIDTDNGKHSGTAEFNCPSCGPGTCLAGEVSDWNEKQEREDRKMAKKTAKHALGTYTMDCSRMTAIMVTVGRYTASAERK